MKLWKVLKFSPGGTLTAQVETEGSVEPKSSGVARKNPQGQTIVEPQGKAEVNLVERPLLPEPNEHPEDRTIFPGHRHTWFHRLMRLILHPERIVERGKTIFIQGREVWRIYVTRQLTPEERQYQDERKRRQRMSGAIYSDAMLYWDRMVNALDRRGFTHRPAKEDNKGFRPTRHVGFDQVKLQPEAVYYRLNTARLPHGTAIMALMDRDLMVDLSIAVGRRVSAEYSERIGAWYIVERALGVRGIPDHVRFADMLEGMPASADGLTVPIGTALNAKPIYRSLGRMYSMLVAGTIGGGKSNYLNILLVTLIRRNSPERLKLILVDLKGGLEFQFYEGIPHLIPVPGVAPTGIADQNEQVPGVLKWLHHEGERRMDVLREAGYKSIGRYNAYQQKRRLPHIMLVIDEWADVMYNRAIRAECEETLANVAQRFRAVGIHVILCTQIPKTEVLTTRIKGVLPAKLAFSVPTNAASMVIIDNGDARQLQPAGRCVFQWDGQYEVQTPFINEEYIDAIVDGAKKGTYDDTLTPKHDVTQQEVMEWSLGNENGFLSRDRLLHQFNKRGLTQEELDLWLQGWDNQEFVIGTSLFRVEPASGNRPRRLIAVDEDADDKPDHPEPKRKRKSRHNVVVDEILEYAAIYSAGSLAVKPLFEYFQPRGITQPELMDMLTTMDGQEYDVGSYRYRVMPPNGNRQPRKMKLVKS